MVMSVVQELSRSSRYPELEGARVLITGLEAGHGVDIARAFADAGCRLLVHTRAPAPELDIVLEMLAGTAEELEVREGSLASDQGAIRFAQESVQVFGGFDVVINLARIDANRLAVEASAEEVEDLVAGALGGAFRITQVLANRMALTWKHGLIVNVLAQAPPATAAAAAACQLARAGLASMTRRLAQEWAGHAVRINAVAPTEESSCEPGASEVGLRTEPEIASLALHLASRSRHELSGLVFDAAAA